MSAPPPLAHNPNFHRLWSARAISRFGSSLGYVALLWLTFAETNSALAVAYVGLAGFVPTIVVGIFSGALVDRFERRRVIVLSTLGRSAAMGALVLLLYVGGFHLAFVLVASLVFSACATFFAPGSQALLPEIVDRGSLANANGLFESTEAIAGIAGNGLGGGLVLAVGAVPTLGIDAASYLVGAILVALIAVAASSPRPSDGGPRPRMWEEVREGFAYLRNAVALFELTMLALVLNFLISVLLTFIVVYSTSLLHGSAVVYGLLEACLAGGYGVGALLVGRFGLTRHTGAVWIYSTFAQGALLVLVVLVARVPVALPAFLAFGVLQGLANVTWLSSVQATVPERLQGRYFAIDNALSYAAIPLAQIVGGVLIAFYGVGPTLLAVGLATLAAGVGALFLRELRQYGYDPSARTA
jgi:MFS transporter, DHA3 family, macrolide efflux protein